MEAAPFFALVHGRDGRAGRSLPPGLEVETWGGQAWIGIIPFKMQPVRPRFLPPVPVLSYFPELNVRTYVRDRTGRSGVWFFSLDCSQPLAVWVARLAFGLPYFHAAMSERIRGRISYECRRRGFDRVSRFEYAGSGAPFPLARVRSSSFWWNATVCSP